MGINAIPVADLRLDSQNPRHDPVSDEREIIDALLEEVGPKILALAEDIVEHGLSPIDIPLVLEDGPGPSPTYTILEGNRRIAALKLLNDPALTTRGSFPKRFAALKSKMSTAISDVTCHVVTDRQDAKHWQELRHRGENSGRGVVPWNAEASARFFGRTSRQVGAAIAVIDAAKKAYPANKTLQDALDRVRKERISTLGRFITDPDVRRELGLVLDDANVTAHYDSNDLELVLMRVAQDMSTTVTVADVDSKLDRAQYLSALAPLLPNRAKRRAHAAPLATVRHPAPTLPPAAPRTPPPTPAPIAPAPVPLAPADPVPGPPARPTPRGPRHLFEGVQVHKLGARVGNILGEVQRLDVDSYPNASAVLMRVVIELAVTEVFQHNDWPLQTQKPGKEPRDKTLNQLVRECLDKLDPTGKDKKWQAVRSGLNDPNSLLAVATLNAWVHNARFHPVPNDLRLTADNYADFLRSLDSLV
jgi:hypothetical protein